MDNDTKLAIVSLLEALREALKSVSETRILTLRIHDALLKARVPGYLESYEGSLDSGLSELTELKTKLAHVVDGGIQVLRENCAR